MVQVYRIENSAGEGPWVAEFNVGTVRRTNPRIKNPSDMPGMHSDSETVHALNIHMDPDFVFGWRTKTQMRRWFSPAMLRELEKGGHRLSVYDVPMATFTDTQATFERSRATLIREENLK